MEEKKEETDGFDKELSEGKGPCETCTSDEEEEFQSCNVIIKTEAGDMALCPVCDLSLPEGEMMEHINEHDNDLQYECHICKLTFTAENALKDHITVHGSEKQHVFHVFTKKGNLVEKFKIQYEEGKLKCLMCKLRFEDGASLNRHLATHDMLSSAKEDSCHICDKIVPEEGLSEHILNHTEEGEFVCQICLLSFNEKESLSNHYDKHRSESPNKCTICDRDCVTVDALEFHLKSCTSKKYKEVCKICNELFLDEEKLKEHVLTHETGKPYRCELCDRCFKLSGSLRNHQATHLENKPHVCQHCGKGFIKPCFLRAHEESHSENRERPFICDICNRGFTKSYNLKKHKRTHEPAESKELFTCKVCGVSMTIKSSLERHMLKHTGENKLHRCELCTKWYNTSHALKLHMYTHTGDLPHKCGICDKKFSEPNRVKRHMRVHTGERAYSCAVCDKTYKCQQDLNHHMTKHTGERKYLCNECGDAFAKHRDLKYHMKGKHDIDITSRSNMEV